MLDDAGRRGVAEEGEGAPDDGELFVGAAGVAERVAEGELDAERAGHAELLAPVGHHGDEDGADAGGLDGACQHGHAAGAVRSDWCE